MEHQPSHALPPALGPGLRRACALSKRRQRQIWIIWTGRRIALRTAWRPGCGTLLARAIGDEIHMAEARS